MQNFRKAALHLTKKLTNGYTERENMVLDATSNDSAAPSRSQMREIALMTYKYDTFVEVMEMLDMRLSDIGKNWRHSLMVLEYILRRGSENVLLFLRDNIENILMLGRFEYIDNTGEDHGVHVRQQAAELVRLVRRDPRHREELYNVNVHEVNGSVGSSGRHRRVTNHITGTRVDPTEFITVIQERYRAEEGSKTTIEGSREATEESEPLRDMKTSLEQSPVKQSEEVGSYLNKPYRDVEDLIWLGGDDERMQGVEQHVEEVEIDVRRTFVYPDRQFQGAEGLEEDRHMEGVEHQAAMYEPFLQWTGEPQLLPSEMQRQDADNDVPRPGFGMNQVENMDVSAIPNDQNHLYVAQIYPYSEKKVLNMCSSLPTTTRMNTFLPGANMALPTPQIATRRPQFASSNPFKLQAEQEAAQANSLQQQHIYNHGRDQSENIHFFKPLNDVLPSHSTDSVPYTTLYNPDVSLYQHWQGISEGDYTRQVQLHFPHSQREGRPQHHQLALLRRREEWARQHLIQSQQQRQHAHLDETWKAELTFFSQPRRGPQQIQQQPIPPQPTDGAEVYHSEPKPFKTTDSLQVRSNKTLYKLVAILNEHRHYQSLLKCNSSDAQIILELCQMLLDSYEVASDIRRQIVTAMQRLAAKSKTFPSYFFIHGPISLAHEDAISSGSFGDIYKATLHTETLCLKVLRANRSILEKLAK
ncbi:hypothetical protein DXG01_005637, partial [Tephrocybe rancida]